MEEKNIVKLQELVSNARKALAAGDRMSVRQLGEMLIAGFPKSEEGWLVLASISEPEEALTHLENALRVNPGSQAARQGIRLVTSQFLKENQAVEGIAKNRGLEDTQPLKVNEYSVVEVDSQSEYDDLDELVSSEPAQEISSPESDQVTAEEALVETESMPEIMDDSSLVEEFPEEIPDLPIQENEVAKDNELDKKELISSSDTPISKMKIRIRKKSAKTIDHTETKSENKPLRIGKTRQDTQSKTINVEFVEFLLIAGAAVLLPVLVFLYFYFGK